MFFFVVRIVFFFQFSSRVMIRNKTITFRLFNKAYCLTTPTVCRVHATSTEVKEKREPLNGVRVCDMTRVLAGPYCTMVLGDMGAEIIKIERPGHGDETRKFGPPFLNSEKYLYRYDKEHWERFNIQENFVPGKLKEMGFGYEKLQNINPMLIYCSITGFGQKGRDSKKPGYDLIANAQGGMLHITGEKDGKPCRPGVALVDIVTGMYVNGAIIAALYERKFSGKGKKIDASLLQTQVAMLSDVASSFLNFNIETTRHGTAHPSIVPYQAFDTLDEKILVAAGNNRHFVNLCKAIECQELLRDERFRSNPDRVKNREALIIILKNRLKENSSKYWLECFDKHGVPSSLINDMEVVFNMPQISSLGVVQEMHHPTAGIVRVPGPAVEFDNKQPPRPIPAPLLGQHTVEIMQSVLNMDSGMVRSLLKEKVIVQNDFNCG
ncbi:succinate--hydroxymethylglutarate CoA-transferase-like isoform X2 [Hydractinia symbiolongicarpus]|uniref:succinate--hydroxymethylglutarate CoA-transferase-like isoform X2 n=1 Tax=Hydractinia symbiolongicarpus TaxID=13093 RepID=UPI00254D74A9|nr:succinate--hydroxymethylglutarate CoA-transferase-like isoform X2 [Hydractinia symbiolongicarpus]